MQSLQTGALDAVPRMKYPHLPHMCSCQINMQAWFPNRDSQGGETPLEMLHVKGQKDKYYSLLPQCMFL